MENVFKKNPSKHSSNIFVDIIPCPAIFFPLIRFYMNDKYWIACAFMRSPLFEKAVTSSIKSVSAKDDKGWTWILIHEPL